jgi:hypothetical protein
MAVLLGWSDVARGPPHSQMLYQLISSVALQVHGRMEFHFLLAPGNANGNIAESLLKNFKIMHTDCMDFSGLGMISHNVKGERGARR